MIRSILGELVDPAGFGVGPGVAVGDVWFDVEDGGAVHEVVVADEDFSADDVDQADAGEADGIGAMGAAGGEEAAALLVAGWDDCLFDAGGVVELK